MSDPRSGASSRRLELPAVNDWVESSRMNGRWPIASLLEPMSGTSAPVEVPIRVVLVDDDEDAFILTRDLLLRSGDPRFSLAWAKTFDAGLALLGSNQLSVGLVDYQLGERTGLDFLREAQKRSFKTPLIMLTGRGDRAVDGDAGRAGAADYLDKSELTPALLERSIRHAIDRSSTQRQLRDSEELHRSIVTSIAEGVIVLSDRGTVLAANPTACRIFQIVRAALVGRLATDDEWQWLDAAGAPLVGRNHPLRVVEARPERSRIVGLHRRDGTTRWLEMSTGSMGDVRRNAAFVVSFEDVTEAREAAQRLIRADQIDALDRLAGEIAHDFNNLITVMRAGVDLLLADSDPVDPNHELLASLHGTTVRASDLTRRLLDLRGQSATDPRVLDLPAFVASMGRIIRELVGARIELELAEFDQEALVRIDPIRLEHVLLSLAANARDAMPGSGRLVIGVGVEPATGRSAKADHRGTGAEWVSLIVRDSGHGMDDATLARVFEPYFSTKGRGRGTGLGLASVYGTVVDSGGDIRIESKVGAGTTVRILLPRVSAPGLLSA